MMEVYHDKLLPTNIKQSTSPYNCSCLCISSQYNGLHTTKRGAQAPSYQSWIFNIFWWRVNSFQLSCKFHSYRGGHLNIFKNFCVIVSRSNMKNSLWTMTEDLDPKQKKGRQKTFHWSSWCTQMQTDSNLRGSWYWLKFKGQKVR